MYVLYLYRKRIIYLYNESIINIYDVYHEIYMSCISYILLYIIKFELKISRYNKTFIFI